MTKSYQGSAINTMCFKNTFTSVPLKFGFDVVNHLIMLASRCDTVEGRGQERAWQPRLANDSQ